MLSPAPANSIALISVLMSAFNVLALYLIFTPVSAAVAGLSAWVGVVLAALAARRAESTGRGWDYARIGAMLNGICLWICALACASQTVFLRF